MESCIERFFDLSVYVCMYIDICFNVVSMQSLFIKYYGVIGRWRMYLGLSQAHDMPCVKSSNTHFLVLSTVSLVKVTAHVRISLESYIFVELKEICVPE